jgi:hypothetical protein
MLQEDFIHQYSGEGYCRVRLFQRPCSDICVITNTPDYNDPDIASHIEAITTTVRRGYVASDRTMIVIVHYPALHEGEGEKGLDTSDPLKATDSYRKVLLSWNREEQFYTEPAWVPCSIGELQRLIGAENIGWG